MDWITKRVEIVSTKFILSVQTHAQERKSCPYCKFSGAKKHKDGSIWEHWYYAIKAKDLPVFDQLEAKAFDQEQIIFGCRACNKKYKQGD